MTLETDAIAMALRTAREKKGLSQRELSALSGVRQSQISMIEKGLVDLRLSSLIELARALDLELTLVPQSAVPAVLSFVQSIVRSAAPSSEAGQANRLAVRDLHHLSNMVAEHRAELPLKPEEVAQLQRQLRELPHYPLSESDRHVIRSANQAIQAYLSDPQASSTVRNALAQLRTTRNEIAHRAAAPSAAEAVRPAYTLDEDDHA